jgi:elongation factor Tu
MTTDPTFHMIIEDIFNIRNLGLVVTGKIETGTLKVGDQVTIKAQAGEKRATVSGIEMFRKTMEQAGPGDNVGLLLKDILRNDIQKGNEILSPDNDFTWKP